MLLYLLKFSVCLATLLVFYKLFLERESIHVFKRFYLLASLIFSLIVPLLVFTEYVVVETGPVPLSQPLTFSNEVLNVPPALEADAADISPLLWALYFLGVLFFSVKFLKNLFQIFNRIRKNPKLKELPFVRVLLLQELPPHTFFKYIFLNKEKLEANQIPKEVLLHEETHARQKHSLDVLFIELLQIVMWFNPLIYFIRKSIKLNHEFLADQAVLKKGVTPSTYQNTLLSFMSPIHHQSLANAINYSSIKKRFTVMKSKTSKKSVFLRSLLLLPLLGILLLSFAQKRTLEVFSENTQNIEGIWLEESTENYAFSIINLDGTLKIHWGNTISSVSKIDNQFFANINGTLYPLYLDKKTGLMSYFNQNFILEAHSMRKKFEGDWKSVNGGVKISIKNYTDSFIWTISRDGRANKFYPKKVEEGYQLSYGDKIQTFKMDGDKLLDSEGTVYKRVPASEQKGISSYVDESIARSPNSDKQEGATERQISEYERLLKKYAESQTGQTRMSTEEINLLKKLSLILSPEQKSNLQSEYKLDPIYDSSGQKGASREEMKRYNLLAKKYLQQPIETRTIPLADLRILETVYNRMTSKQQQAAQPFPECLPPKAKAQDGATREQMREYNKLAKKYNNMAQERMRILLDEVERLRYIYSIMSDKQRADAEPFPDFPPMPEPPEPPSPEMAASAETSILARVAPSPAVSPRIAQSNVGVKPAIATRTAQGVASPKPPSPPSPETAVLADVANVPPPPPPKTPEELVEEMAQKNAEFYFNGEKITASRALEILEESDRTSLVVRHTNRKRPRVDLSDKPIEVHEDE